MHIVTGLVRPNSEQGLNLVGKTPLLRFNYWQTTLPMQRWMQSETTFLARFGHFHRTRTPRTKVVDEDRWSFRTHFSVVTWLLSVLFSSSAIIPPHSHTVVYISERLRRSKGPPPERAIFQHYLQPACAPARRFPRGGSTRPPASHQPHVRCVLIGTTFCHGTRYYCTQTGWIVVVGWRTL